MRVFMRLEQLFQQVDHFMSGNTEWDSRAVISTLLEITSIFSRNDLKSEILKEIDRHSNVLNKMVGNHNIDSVKLNKILNELARIGEQLYATPGKIGQSLMESELFKSISQRSSIPGGAFAFDLPAYHYWLQQSEQTRRQELENWLKPFAVIRQGVTMLLNFIRQSATPGVEVANAGFFQKTLDHSLPYQILRVGVERSRPCFAEISGGKHRFTIRFMSINGGERPSQATQDIEFQLTSCIL